MNALRNFGILILLAAGIPAKAQIPEAQHAHLAASGSYKADNLSVDWAVGEAVADTFDGPSIQVGAGLLNLTGNVLVTGDLKEERKQPLVYPIPFVSEFYIEFMDSPTGFDFKLLDVSGKRVDVVTETSTNICRVQTPNLASGYYMLIVNTHTTVSTYKLVKK